MPLQKLALQEIVGTKEYFNQTDYIIFNVLYTGYVPTEIEVDMVFATKEFLTYLELHDIMIRKLSCDKKNLLILEMFRAFDHGFKGYIDTSDLWTAWKSAAPRLSWEILHESFNELAPEGNLDFKTFKHLCLISGLI